MITNHWKQKTIRFLIAQMISLLGSSIVQYAIIWHITLTTTSGKMLMISTLCGFLPQIIISLFAGVWIDRYDRKQIIMAADGIIACSTLLLAIAFLCGYRSIWLFFIILAIRSAGTGIQTPAVNSILPQIVPQEQLMRINGINAASTSFIMFVSPVISGTILSITSLAVTLFIDIITAVIGIGITFMIEIPKQTHMNKIKHSQLMELKEGFSYIKHHSFIWLLLIYQIFLLFLISPSAFLTPLMISRVFGSEIWRLTMSEMTYSLGMVIGGIIISSWGGFKNRMHTILLAGTCYGLLMPGLGAAPYFLIYLIFNTFIGITSPCYQTAMNVILQENVEPQMHGRMFSLMQISSSCALPMGMVLFGPLADICSIKMLLMFSGFSVLGLSAYVWKRIRLIQTLQNN